MPNGVGSTRRNSTASDAHRWLRSAQWSAGHLWLLCAVCAGCHTEQDHRRAGPSRAVSNGQISYAYDGDLAAALLPLAYGMSLIKTSGQGYHHTFMVLYDATGQMLTVLPADAAQAISATFRRMKNPYRVPYHRHP